MRQVKSESSPSLKLKFGPRQPLGLEQKWDLKAKLMGMPERKAVETLLAHFWPPEKEGEMFARECPFTIDTFLSERNLDLDAEFAKVEPMPGAVRLVKHLAKHGIPICVATGSKTRNFDIKKSNNAELYDPFDGRFICGDDPRLDRERGKPFPDIFLLAAREGLREDHFKSVVRDLGAEHDGTSKGGEGGILVFEDAVGGVSAAKAAGMQVVWVPDQEVSNRSERGNERYALSTHIRCFRLVILTARCSSGHK